MNLSARIGLGLFLCALSLGKETYVFKAAGWTVF